MKIYIVTCGEYSDYGILAAFLDETKAKMFVETYNRGYRTQYHDEAKTEEYEEGVPFDFETLNVYVVRFYNDESHDIHDIAKKELHNMHDFQKPLPSVTASNNTFRRQSNISFIRYKYFVTVAAKDEEYAFKIACDALEKWKAEQEGL